MESSFKEKAHTFCQEYVDSKLASVQREIIKLNEALQSETKSTAGDKHETGRAMIQLEREKLGRQLAEVEKMKMVFARIPKKLGTSTVGLGSLVKTNKALYFIAISAGKCVVEGKEVYCVSVATPMGKLLLGKAKGHFIHFNSQQQEILEVF